MSTARPDTAAILSQLKDFQRKTVDHVFRRMYLDDDCVRRFLVGDEVGLGKTLVARGVIAKTIDHFWNSGRRIDVVYVCSNADIARQNINRLNVTGQKDFELASRITLLPLSLSQMSQPNHRLNFVSFTPGTSFEQSGSGWSLERELLFWLLRRNWEFSEAKGTLVLQGTAETENFRRRIRGFDRDSIHPGVADQFSSKLDATPEFRKRFMELCERVPRKDAAVPEDVHRDCKTMIGDLRKLLAQTCLHWLEPDLIILDEFQRFKHLLSDGTPAGQLAHDLFNYQQSHDDPSSAARVLLLSATPYKMYTLSHESGEDDHYADFQNTLDFLLAQPESKLRFRQSVQNYRESLYRIAEHGTEPLTQSKRQLEQELRRVMVRTERLALGKDRNGMLREIPPRKLELAERDIEQYLAIQRVARAVEHDDVLEYWKSAPYLLNFMEEYELKRKLEHNLEGKQSESFQVAMQQASQGLLNRPEIVKYQAIDPANARLRSLIHDTVDRGAWKLLWLPPSLPYYAPKAPFADPELQSFTKRLVFSCWRVVPKAIAALVSYEAERRMMRHYRKKIRNTVGARKKRRPLLRFAVSKGRLTGMPALMLAYPSRFLAEEFDPLRMCARQIATGVLPSSDDLLARVEERIGALLQPWTSQANTGGATDDSWYWAAPLLLDLEHDRSATTVWLQTADLDKQWSLHESGSEDKARRGWKRHVAEFRKLVTTKNFVGSLGAPPADLVPVIARQAIAGPGVCALRTLLRVTNQHFGEHETDLRMPAGTLAHAVLHLFNLPEVTSFVRDRKDKVRYWERVLRYSLAGNFQAMLDEYGHQLAELENASTQPVLTMAEAISTKIQAALTLRASTAQADIVNVKSDGVSLGKPLRMRTRFAMRFGDQVPDQGTEPTRADHVRMAFNSPFWPFVLATTSVGQEGLDFHPYCHAVVHWNLPSNPVDLEQREGRIHRYKGHALRKNLAAAFAAAIDNGHPDPWSAVFDAARNCENTDRSGLYPFWVCDQGDHRIERHVPALPHSRDVAHHANLRRSLVLYRMVFGQNRQEDLVAYLASRLSEAEIENVVSQCRIDLSPAADPINLPAEHR